MTSNLKKLRQERNIKQQDLANILGVSVDAVSSWERGLRTPSIAMINNLAEFFQVDKEYLMGLKIRYLRVLL